MATYGPGIDQSQHAKSVSHIIIGRIWQLFSCFLHGVNVQLNKNNAAVFERSGSCLACL